MPIQYAHKRQQISEDVRYRQTYCVDEKARLQWRLTNNWNPKWDTKHIPGLAGLVLRPTDLLLKVGEGVDRYNYKLPEGCP